MRRLHKVSKTTLGIKKKYIYTQDGMKERGAREEGAPLYSRKRGWVSMRGGGL